MQAIGRCVFVTLPHDYIIYHCHQRTDTGSIYMYAGIVISGHITGGALSTADMRNIRYICMYL